MVGAARRFATRPHVWQIQRAARPDWTVSPSPDGRGETDLIAGSGDEHDFGVAGPHRWLLSRRWLDECVCGNC